MNIIGINSEMYISSAALVVDGKLVSGSPEERLIREKHTRKFPQKALNFILNDSNLTIEDIDYFAVSWNPGVYFKKFNPLYSGKRRHMTELLFSIPDYLTDFYKVKNIDYTYEEIMINNNKLKIYFITHHRAHSANGFFMSPFDRAAIFTADAQGEFESTTFGIGEGNRIKIYKSIKYPQSLGMFYSTFTEFLGFEPNSAEWKVMALSSFADYNNKYYKLIKNKIINLKEDGEFEFDLSFFNGFIHEQPYLFTEKFIELFGKQRGKNEELTDRHYEIASAMQKITEEIITHSLNYLFKLTKTKNLVLSGGTFMNSVFNGRVLELTPFENLYVSFAPDDSGTSVGAALFLYNHILKNQNRYYVNHSYLGPYYNDDKIANILKSKRLKHKKSMNIESDAAKLIAKGNVIGWFQGRMEFGQRALGNRSILADPTDKKMKNKVNKKVKYRESFRPFAPSVLKEYQNEYFDMGGNNNSLFMERVVKVKKDKIEKIPSVVHVDGSARVQTVIKETNLKYYNLIKEYFKLKGVPLLLNTSFNLAGEPIVCTVEDAIKTFFNSGMDYLILNNFIIEK